MIGVVASLALLAAMGAVGVAALRRSSRVLDPLEQLVYGVPLGVVAASLVLLVLASGLGLGPGLVAAVAAASALGAWALWPRGDARPASGTDGFAIPLLPALVLGAFIVRWALLWGTALTYDDQGLWAGYVNFWGDWSQHLGES